MTQVDNQNFGCRDLDDKSYTSRMRNVYCGWLYQDENNGYRLENCGKPKRVSIKEVDKCLGGNTLFEFISETDFNVDRDKLARRKYEIIYQKMHHADLSKSKEEYEKFIECQDYLLNCPEGTYVLTGQSSKRYYDPEAVKPKVGKDGKKTGCWKGKEKEFLFLNNKKTKSLPVDEQLFRSFEKIHKDSEDYVKFWRIKLNKGQKIPVFFILENEKIHSMGLSSLYRYPSRMSIFDAIPKELKNPENLGKENKIEMDLAECMFGFAFGGEALKGRVQFGHAMAVGNPIPLTDKVFVSSTPHPSFYPLYVKNGNDWNHASRINGRKRYPVRNQADYKNEGTDNMSQVASMLNAGTSFTEYIRFNNLRPIELGALLSALTFHGMHSQCCHNLGFGKPFGYGKVKVSKLNLQTSEGNDVAKYMQAFENAMITAIPDWLHSDQMVELLSMAKGVPSGKNAEFQYLRMSTNQKENEFKQVKDNSECLKSFSHISSVKVVGESVSGKEFSDFADKEAEMREMMLQEQKEKDAARKDKNLQNLNLSFLDEENRFKKGWDALKTRLKNCGLEFNSSVMEFISEQDKQRLVNFVKRMFARKDSKWGKNNNDYAKDFARKEVEAFIGKKPEDL